MSRWWQRLVLLAACAGAAGCGPSIGLNADIKAIGYDVFFGAPDVLAPPAPSQPAPAPLAVAPVYILPQLPSGSQPEISFIPQPQQVACPTPSPIAYPAKAATLTGPAAPPQMMSYGFRVTGSYTVDPGGSGEKVSYYPNTEMRQVRDVTQPDATGAFAFSVVRVAGDASTTTTYKVYPNGPANTNAGSAGTPAAGLYITGYKDSAGSAFNPTGTGVEIMAFPAIPSNPYQGQGTDPVTQTTVTMNPPAVVAPGLPVGLPTKPPSPPSSPNPAPSGFQTRGSHPVNACGDMVDSVETEILGTITHDAQVTNFDYTFDSATQFGGIIVAEHLVETGTDPSTGKPFKRDYTATINQVPKG
jgi:hypothetical protein